MKNNIIKHRDWQIKAFKTVDACNMSTSTEVIPVNACVGSGKTNVASYALGSFIKNNIDKKTIQAFITPRIKLCAQQTNEISEFIESEFKLINGKDYDLVRKDCTQRDLNLCNDSFTSKHVVFVICDESLWGTDKNASDPDKRWHRWMHFFDKRKDEGYVFGNIVFDEAHNFTNKYSKIMENA